MSVTVTLEPDEGPAIERCCFCRDKTKHWYFPGGVENAPPRNANEVACCEKCARVATIKDMPSKDEWMRRERIVYSSRERGVYYT